MKGPGYYDKLSSQKCKDDDQIRLDIPRTNLGDFNREEEELEKLQGVIFNVLNAFVNYDPQVGYVQGMNHIVGALAYHLHPSKYQNIKCKPKKPKKADLAKISKNGKI